MDKNMSARQYLSQAYRLDERINSKLEQLAQLKCMATSISSNLSDVYVQSSHNDHHLEDTILKIVEQEKEIDSEVDALLDLKADIRHTIDMVDDIDLQLILQKRYLMYEDWSQISVKMNISAQHTFRLHNKALMEIDRILKLESK